MQNQIPKNWQKVKIEDLLEKVIDNRGKNPPFSDNGYRVIETYQLNRENRYPTFDNSKQKYVSKETYDNWFRSGHPEYKDILVSTVGSGIPQWNMVPNDGIYCITQNLISLRCDRSKANPDFLFNYFRQKKFLKTVKGIIIGGAQPSIKVPHLLELELEIPSPEEQKKIASILSAFDDKIEVNNKSAKILEEMAQALFKEWFVYFRFPGYEKVEFADSEHGTIPVEWKRSSFNEYARLEYGKALQEDTRIKGDVLVYGSSGLVGTHNAKLLDGPGIVVGRKGNVGSIFWVNDDFYPIDTTFYVDTKNSLYYIYFILKNMRFHTGDSAVPGLNRESVHSQEIIVPSEVIVSKFDSIIKPMFGKINQLHKENQKLAALRDLLLPKLMKGEIKI